jgi:hypothetical protein
MEIVRFTAREVEQAGYSGPMGGAVRGAHYALRDDDGYISIDGGRTVYMLAGKHGKAAMQRVIDAGGFIGVVYHRDSL